MQSHGAAAGAESDGPGIRKDILKGYPVRISRGFLGYPEDVRISRMETRYLSRISRKDILGIYPWNLSVALIWEYRIVRISQDM